MSKLMDTEAIRKFIRAELSQGKGIDDVKQKLKAQGYSHELIEAASIEFFAEEHMSEIMAPKHESEGEIITEKFLHSLTLTHVTFAIAFIGIAYIITQHIMSDTLEVGVYTIGLYSARFLIEGFILFMVLSFMQRNYNPEESIELQQVTFVRCISYIIFSGLVLSGLNVLIPTNSLDMLAVIMFFVFVFVRYILLMLFFNIFSFLKFTLIAVFFAATSWGFNFAAELALRLLPA